MTNYFYCFQSRYQEVTKIGITNHPEDRLKTHLLNGLVEDDSAYLMELINPTEGNSANQIEQDLRDAFRQHIAGYDLIYSTKEEAITKAKSKAIGRGLRFKLKTMKFSDL